MELVQSKVDRIISLFKQEDLVEANELLSELDQEIQSRPNILSRINSIPEIRALREDVADTTYCLNMLEDMSGWELNNDSDGIRTYISGSGNEFLVRSEAEIETGIFPILVLLAEPDMLTKWLPMLSDVKIVGEPTKYRRILNYKFNLPWPVSDREASILGRGVPLVDSKGLVIIMKTLEESYLGIDIPATSPDSIKITVHLSCIYIQYSEENKCSITLIIRSDPKIPLIPQWLINYGSKHVAHIFIQSLRENACNFSGSDFEERVKARPEFYDDIRKKLEDYRKNYL